MSSTESEQGGPVGPAVDIEAVASLAEPVRRRLYAFVGAATEPVTRDEAADGVGVSRQVAAYHLDRLADDGLLDVDFRRLTGREGPGAGRPSKLYRRSAEDYEVSVPPRRYQLAARILLEALRSSRVDFSALSDVARRTGSELGTLDLAQALVETGYEPAVVENETRFRNCPFHVLRDQDREITCRLNLALVEGMIQGTGGNATAVLAPEEGFCCVRIRPPVAQQPKNGWFQF